MRDISNCFLPFPEKRHDEYVILTLRRHWIVLFLQLSRLSFLAAVPIIAYMTAHFGFAVDFFANSPLYPILVIVTSLYYLFVWESFFRDFLDYYLDVWVLTNQRIVSTEQKGLFNRMISELNIIKIEDVTSDVKGFFATFLDYGEVRIQTAGAQERFFFKQIPHPRQVAEMIMQAHNASLGQTSDFPPISIHGKKAQPQKPVWKEKL